MRSLAHFLERLSLPLEGKGDRSAVDEVTGRHIHCRGALCADLREMLK